MSIQAYTHAYAQVVAVQYTAFNFTECAKIISDELVQDKLNFFRMEIDNFKNTKKFTYRYIDESTDRNLNQTDWLVKLTNIDGSYKWTSMTAEEFVNTYPTEGSEPITPEAETTLTLNGPSFNIVSNKELKGMLIVGTGIRVGSSAEGNQYAYSIQINDFSAESTNTPVQTLGVYKWIEPGQTEPTPATTVNYAYLIDNQDYTRSLYYGNTAEVGESKFVIQYSISSDKLALVITDVEHDLFLASGSQVIITYTDDTTSVHEMIGTGVIN